MRPRRRPAGLRVTSVDPLLTSPLFWAASIIAVTAVGFGKGGFGGLGVLGVPLMALAMSPVQAAAILLPILIVQDAVSIRIFWRTWDLRQVLLMFAGAVLGVVAGFLLAANVSVAVVELVVGAISVLFGLHRLWVERPGAHLSAVAFPNWVGVLAGVAAGFTSQIAHAGGPPVQMYLMPQRQERDVFLGTTTLFFALLNWIKVPAYVALGQFTPTNLGLAAALLPVAIFTTWLGAKLARSLHGRLLFTVIYLLMIALGLKLVWDGVNGL